MSCGVKESFSSCPGSSSSGALFIFMSMLLSVFKKATLTWPMSLTPSSQNCRCYGEFEINNSTTILYYTNNNNNKQQQQQQQQQQ